MTPIGHSICGLAVAALAVPPERAPAFKVKAYAAIVVVASAPDWPLPMWGHDRYDISHSFVVATALTVPLALGLVFGFKLPRRLVAGLVAAWYSHMCLDSMYNHGKGLRVFWPLNDERLKMPLPWFETVHSPVNYLAPHSLRVMGIELLAYGSVLVALLVVLWGWRRYRTGRDQ